MTLYRYNPKRLRYEEATFSWQLWLFRLTILIIAASLTGGVLLLLFYFFYDSDSTLKQKQEINQLQQLVKRLQTAIVKNQKQIDSLQQREKQLYRQLFMADSTQASDRQTLLAPPASFKYLKEKVDTLHNRLIHLRQLYRQLSLFLSEEATWKLQQIPLRLPVEGLPLCGFGEKLHPVSQKPYFHKGMDFSVKVGSAVYATADGKVRFAGTKTKGYGKVITIKHKSGYTTLYAHLSKIFVRSGQEVKAGQKIALSGNTGITAGAILHYEIHYQNQPIDPMLLLSLSLPDSLLRRYQTLLQSCKRSLD